jgi:hypothetical protein
VSNLKKSIAAVSIVTIVGVIAAVGLSGGVTSHPAGAQINDNEQIYMTTTAYSTNAALTWGPGTTLSGNGCSTVLAHASPVEAVTRGLHQTLAIGSTGTGSAAGKVSFLPIQISKLVDSATVPFDKALSVGQAFNVQLWFFHPIGAPGIDCTKPDMKITLVGVAGQDDNISIESGGGGQEQITLQYGLQALRTASVNSAAVWSWDTNGGYCWDRVKNIACNAASPPATA